MPYGWTRALPDKEDATFRTRNATKQKRRADSAISLIGKCSKTAILALTLAVGGVSASQAQDAAAQNLKNGQAYLAAMAKQPGVVALPSGVLYRTVSRSSAPGPQPTVADTVTIHYEGKLLNGSVFDSSYARNEPATFPLGRLITAWQQVVPQMHVGDEVILYTPPSAAYGDRDMSPDIPPDSTLIFRIQLLAIADPGAAQ